MNCEYLCIDNIYEKRKEDEQKHQYVWTFMDGWETLNSTKMNVRVPVSLYIFQK